MLSSWNYKCPKSDCSYCQNISDVPEVAIASDKEMKTEFDMFVHMMESECNCLLHGDSETQIHICKGGKLNEQGSPTLLLHIVKPLHHHSITSSVVASVLLCLGDGSPGYPLGKLLVLCQFDVPGKPHVIADYFLTDEFELQKPLWYQEKVDEHALQLISIFNLRKVIDLLLKQADEFRLDHFIQSVVPSDGHVNLLPDTFRVPKRLEKTKCDFLNFPEGHMSLLHYTQKSDNIETTYFLCIDSRDQFYLIVIEFSERYKLQLSEGFFFDSHDLTVSSFVSKESRQRKWSVQYANRVARDVIPKILENKNCRNIQHLFKFAKSQR